MSAASVAVMVTSGERHEGKAGMALSPFGTGDVGVLDWFFLLTGAQLTVVECCMVN